MTTSNTQSVKSFFNPSGVSLLIFLAFSLGLISFLILTPSQTLPLWISAVASGGLGYVIIPILQKIKASQIIQEDGPQTHLKKAGTPTMGGIFFVPTSLIVALIMTQFSSQVIGVV